MEFPGSSRGVIQLERVRRRWLLPRVGQRARGVLYPSTSASLPSGRFRYDENRFLHFDRFLQQQPDAAKQTFRRPVCDTSRESYRVWRGAPLAAALAPQTLADFRQRGPLAVRQPQIPRRMCLQNPVLGRQILILQQEFLIDQSGNVVQEPRPCGFVCFQSPS